MKRLEGVAPSFVQLHAVRRPCLLHPLTSLVSRGVQPREHRPELKPRVVRRCDPFDRAPVTADAEEARRPAGERVQEFVAHRVDVDLDAATVELQRTQHALARGDALTDRAMGGDGVARARVHCRVDRPFVAGVSLGNVDQHDTEAWRLGREVVRLLVSAVRAAPCEPALWTERGQGRREAAQRRS